MKIALLADAHWGAKNDSQWYNDRLVSFFREKFIPYISNNDIQHVFILGDWYDRRKYINFNTLQVSKEILREIISSIPGKVFIIVGNHDTYYKSTIKLNSITETLDGMDIIIIDDIYTEIFDSKKIVFVPWVVEQDIHNFNNVIRTTDADICCGHFEMKDAVIMKDIKSKKGMSFRDFLKFDHVFSGHYHKPSITGNFHYIGSPIQLTWNDYGDEKKFSVYDTELDDIQHIYSNDNTFVKIYYSNSTPRIIPQVETYKDKVLKIIVESMDDGFDPFIQQITDDIPLKVDIIEQCLIDVDTTSDSLDKDTLSIIFESVDNLEESLETIQQIKDIFQSIYAEVNV